MTSTTGTDGHPEVAEISALTEGILPPARTADLREHLADCVICDDVRVSLDEIRGLLGTLPGPVRMPADIAGRIDAALAAEALLDATSPQTAEAAVSRETATQSAEHVSRETADLVSRETVTADRPAGRPRAATGPGRRSPAPRVPRGPRPRRWTGMLIGTACAAAALGVGTVLLQGGNSGGDSAAPSPGRQAPSAIAVTELKSRVQDVLKDLKSGESRGVRAQDSTETVPFQDSGTTAPNCVQQAIGRPESALVTRQERFTGTDTYLVVFAHSGDDTLVDVYVVAADCAASSPGIPGKVLVNQTITRS
ncbi:hypothetical protein I5Q34_10715 [Streptomyces sp. AV19]|uniref:hypothetical protein n=1 Tax=Streptomyces sp. AV19 TaxID=2793068 RepID=UPI0018FE9353|nr:hypothetical protein [Streptomyces sp. AV19]MBH1934745.1 hypothetical protein [Streptomyces sp. AV19]MDG4530716.1 hypothetical protein [Streptomyces sp. AV19]